ncbi:hypothetical protein Tco_0196490 [Tanacetum coccineum]
MLDGVVRPFQPSELASSPTHTRYNPLKTPKCKALSKGSKTGKSASAKELVEEPIAKVAMDDAVNTAGEDVIRDDDQPLDTSESQTYKIPNQDWFKQPPRPPTPDLEWNKRQVVLDQPKQPWFNQMVSATKDPLTFSDLMATPIDFLKIEFKELYTPSYKPPWVIYEDLNKPKRVMRADKLYKFSDGTLKTVRNELHHRILDFRLGYNDDMSRRNWTDIDNKRSELMVELIDKQMHERRIIKNLERLVGAWELEMDYKLMTRTI